MTDARELQEMADKLRMHSLISTTTAGSGHPTSCLSIAEIMSTLFFHEMGQDDEFIMSKGHAVPILWAAYAEAGFIDKKDLNTLRQIDSVLEGHPTPNMPLIKVATGSLGQGLPAAVGMALSKKLADNKGRVIVILGDGECAEGSVWEAANTAAYYKLENLCAIVDVNRLGQSQQTMHGHDVNPYVEKFRAFGWNALAVDGHDISQVTKALEKIGEDGKPLAIIAKTIKGKGVSFIEDKIGWHGKPLSKEDLEKALKEVGEHDITLTSQITHTPIEYENTGFTPIRYDLGQMISTRAAFGDSLVALGDSNHKVVAVDADVKNSTMMGEFFTKNPERGFQAFIAEQNMVGMAIGFSAMGYIPFVSTFSTFLTRAHDFIRMARYSRSNIKFVGSHAGVSIGYDGPSQMGLEDLPMFLNIPDALVIYPSDAVSTTKLMNEMAVHTGISYLRTTREKTPVIYDNDEEFPLGGLKVVRSSEKDDAMIVSAGITLHEALMAHDILKEKGINTRIIDLYSIQPLDTHALVKNASECGGKVIMVEDHYCNAMGSLISNVVKDVIQVCISNVPRSGSPKDLLTRFGLDSKSIAKIVEQTQ
ncbi:transketolase [Candidatus Altiarchaeota archaeon]